MLFLIGENKTKKKIIKNKSNKKIMKINVSTKDIDKTEKFIKSFMQTDE